MRLMEHHHPSLQEFAQLRTISWLDVYDPGEVVSREQFHSAPEVHVWQASTQGTLSLQSDFFSLLSEEERIRVHNYKFVKDQSRYVLSHGILRFILAAYTGRAPSEVKFDYTKYGKPLLTGQTEVNRLHFNMTHAEDAVCCIVSGQNEAGIDLEKMHGDLDWCRIAKQCFSAAEMLFLHSIPSDQQLDAFYYIWTRKEALLKAIGVGLSGMEKMKDNVLPPFRHPYTLISVKLEGDYQCSLAVDSSTSAVKFYRWGINV